MPVDKSYASCKKFLMLEVETRVTCMAMQVLGMSQLSDIPTMNIPPNDDAPDILKKIYLGRVSNIIYENYLSEQVNGTQIMKAVLEEQEVNALQNSQQVDENGRFPCRFVSCNKTFANNGKRRRDHEASHTPPVDIPVPTLIEAIPTPIMDERKTQDDMYSYNISLTR